MAFHITNMQLAGIVLVCAARVWLIACMCTEHTRICTIPSSVFKLGLSGVISEYLTICLCSLRPQRDLDSMVVANSRPAVFAQEQSEVCHGLCLYEGQCTCVSPCIYVWVSVWDGSSPSVGKFYKLSYCFCEIPGDINQSLFIIMIIIPI